MIGEAMGEQRRGLLYAAIAIFFFALSAILIRWAGALSSYEITFWRLVVAAVAVGIAIAWRGGVWLVSAGDRGRFLLFGLITALHFLLYAAALSFTTIAHALAIVYTAPIFVALFSALWLHEPLPRRKWGGILLAVIGVAILAGFQPHFTRRMMVGDLLALGSAITFGLYSVIGRSQRHHYGLLTYAATLYGAAALWTLAPAALHFTPQAYTVTTVLCLVALGLLPLGMGHTLYNAALRLTSATSVNVVATQEVTLGILLGVLLLGEVPQANELVGAAVTLVGVIIVIL